MEKKNQFGNDLTSGSIPMNLIRFALPILLGNLLSTGYSIINTIWVGNLLGRNAVGAVAVSFPIFLGMVALCSGATLATSLLISKAYGAKDTPTMRRIVNNSWTLALILIVTVTTLCVLFAESLLQLMGAPTEVMPLAVSYLEIMALNFSGLYLSYLISSILRGIGDTVMPLFFILVSVMVNAILDPVLILGLGPFPRFGLDGAAIASLAATVSAVIPGLVYMNKKYEGKPILLSKLEYDRSMIIEVLLIGIPSFVQQMLISIGYAFITAVVNSFGVTGTAAFGITSRIDSIVAMPAIAMMLAVSTLTAQHIGAGKLETLTKIFRYGVMINTPIILAMSVSCMMFPENIMRIFVNDADIIGIGEEYLRIVGAGYLLFILFYVSNGIINGAGKTISTMVISFFSLCVIRIPLANLLSQTQLGIRGVWIAILISYATTTVLSMTYLFYGKLGETILKTDVAA